MVLTLGDRKLYDFDTLKSILKLSKKLNRKLLLYLSYLPIIVLLFMVGDSNVSASRATIMLLFVFPSFSSFYQLF